MCKTDEIIKYFYEKIQYQCRYMYDLTQLRNSNIILKNYILNTEIMHKILTLLFGPMKICTHDGRFHCDQILACTMLTNYVTKFKDAQIIRSRDPKIWDECDIVVDVCGKYQPPKLLDHHQIQFQNCYPNYNVRLSSAGLVYLHFPEIIPNILDQIQKNEGEKLTFKPMRSQKIQQQIRDKIYKNFMIYVDANDNGVEKVHDKQFAHVPTSLWARISKLNPMWWDQNYNQMELFKKGMEMAKKQLYSQVRQSFLGSLQTKSIVEEAFEKRKEHHPSGKIIVLQKYVPWQKCIVQIQQQKKCEGQILYLVFPEKSGKKWRIQAVSAKQGSFELRKGLKQQWRGIKDMEKLVALSGIKDIDFVHASGFIGGAQSRQSTILMGEKSL